MKAKVIITKKGERWQESRHPWVYESDIEEMEGEAENGDSVDVYTKKGKYIGSGFLSLNSKIRVRIYNRDISAVPDRDFWKRRVAYAWNYRKTALHNETASCRLIFGESDQFPGLTVDKFNDVLVTQILSYGMEKIKDTVLPLLKEVLEEDGEKIRGIYERNDVSIRKLEGLEEYKGWYLGEG
ncbi:MAG: rRNA large subunit methyltransferase I, partial [Erysipelotrichaceae bacterium]|nr:rRNA large subunit methyltransferase I [Erysipelotrichaceae bacterium]